MNPLRSWVQSFTSFRGANHEKEKTQETVQHPVNYYRCLEKHWPLSHGIKFGHKKYIPLASDREIKWGLPIFKSTVKSTALGSSAKYCYPNIITKLGWLNRGLFYICREFSHTSRFYRRSFILCNNTHYLSVGLLYNYE